LPRKDLSSTPHARFEVNQQPRKSHAFASAPSIETPLRLLRKWQFVTREVLELPSFGDPLPDDVCA
jgi:hypothetical protein